jgi:hypothetical protein
MTKHKFVEIIKPRRGELWLEYGTVEKHSHEMFWYNEGNTDEWKYFAKGLSKQVKKRRRYLDGTKQRMYFRVMVYRFCICLHV